MLMWTCLECIHVMLCSVYVDYTYANQNGVSNHCWKCLTEMSFTWWMRGYFMLWFFFSICTTCFELNLYNRIHKWYILFFPYAFRCTHISYIHIYHDIIRSEWEKNQHLIHLTYYPLCPSCKHASTRLCSDICFMSKICISTWNCIPQPPVLLSHVWVSV